MQNLPTVNRIAWIDWSKAIGLVFVILMHIYFFDGTFRRPIMFFIIPFFFFMSGYLHKNPDNFPEYVKRNVNTLLIPFVLYNLIMILYYVAWAYIFRRGDFDSIVFSRLTSLSMGRNIGQLELPSVPSWFLLALFWVKLFVGRAFVSRGTWVYMLAWVAAFVFCYFDDTPAVLHIDSAVFVVPFFLAGWAIRESGFFKLCSESPKLVGLSLLPLSAIMFLLLADVSNKVNFNLCVFSGGLFQMYAAPMFAIFALVFFSMLLDKFAFGFIADISIGSILIFCLHPMFFSFYYFILNYADVEPSSHRVFVPLSMAFVSMFIGWALIVFSRRFAPILIGRAKVF